jgi:hypothetical protein
MAGFAAAPVHAQNAIPEYPAPASLDAFRYADQATEIAAARTAAPASIADHAEILTLGAKDYEVAVKGTNGFTCIVDRSWSKPFEDPEFWNPKIRSPMCFNAAADRSVFPIYRQRTQWVLAGASKSEIAERTHTALTNKTLPTPEVGTFVFMMSKEGYISDTAPAHWHSHVMFLLPITDGAAWGAGNKGAPVASSDDASVGITTFFVLVPKWSDGTSALMEMPHTAGA